VSHSLCLSLAPPLQTGESREFGLVLKGAESLLDYGNNVLAFAFFKKKLNVAISLHASPLVIFFLFAHSLVTIFSSFFLRGKYSSGNDKKKRKKLTFRGSVLP